MSKGRYISGGYVLLRMPDHPLASDSGILAEHRAVLYEKLGPGTHPCHWCGTSVVWARRKSEAKGQRLFADHIDGDRQNNAPGNLVPSCCACNTTRSSEHRVAKRVLRRELWRKERRGASWLQLTLECGHTVVRRQLSPKRAWCAACVGREESAIPEKRTGLGDVIERAVVPDGGYVRAGPMRRVEKEYESKMRQDGSGYVYRYLLACGHEVDRRSPGRTLCACPECLP